MVEKKQKTPDELIQQYEKLLESKGGSIHRNPGTTEEAAVWGWPWYPFREPGQEEGIALVRQQIRNRFLQVNAVFPEKADRPMSPHLAEGHMAAVQKDGGVRAFLQTFLKRIPNWNPFSADWNAAAKILVSTYSVRHEALPNMSLAEVFRYFNTKPPSKVLNSKVPSKSAKKKRKARRLTQARWPTALQQKIWLLRESDTPVKEIAEMLGCTKSNIYKTIAVMNQKLAAASSRSSRSVRAHTNVDDLGERNRKL